MCGIAGQIRADGRPVEREVLERMSAALEHRGPDSRGIHLRSDVGLAAQRLRVIDLETGDQPIYNEDRSVVVVLNGEIYNYRELRERLRRAGHRFTTQGDTETIVHLYEEEGVSCVRSLHGMFAFALWDANRRLLLLARDRVGKKPLFYAMGEGSITFASELHALVASGDVPRELDHHALDCYLAFGYVPAPLSAFRHARKLPPASTLVLRDGGPKIERYWRLDYRAKRRGSPEELQEKIRDGIDRAVRRRLVSDVPLGAFLSGGIDSSAVVAAMARASSGPVRTFSIGFESVRFNELHHARRVARLFETEHHELVVRPDAVAMIPRIVRQYGEPFGDASAVASFYLADLARRHVTVALNGDGGDETFGGYPRYTSNLLAGRLEAVPRGLRQALGAAGERLPRSGRIDSTLNRVRRLSATLAADPGSRYLAYVTWLDGLRRDELYTDDYAEVVADSPADDVVRMPWTAADADALVDVMLDVDVNSYLPGDLLAKIDIATMAHSLEARSPLLDHEFMEMAASLPAEFKVRGLERKVGLRSALRAWLPADVLDRPKQGFELPLVEWFRGDLRDYARDILLDPVATGRGYFRPARVQQLLQRHAEGREDNARGIWALLIFELWHRELVDGPAADRVPAPGCGR